MADQATETVEIAAPADQILAGAPRLRALPDLGPDLKGVSVESRDAEGRGREVTFRAAAMGRSTSYMLRYDYDDAPTGCRGGSCGATSCAGSTAPTRSPRSPATAGRTLVIYDLAVDLVIPLPGFVKRRAEHKIIHTALRELRGPRGSEPVTATRILLFTGKGGVGKTTTAAATAAALRRRRACARSCSRPTPPTRWPTPSTSPLGADRRARSPTTLWGQQLDAQERMEESWGEIQGWLQEVFAWAGVDAIEAEELAVHPRPRRDLRPRRHQDATPTSGEWDVIVVDCAPTAETIRFLSLPDILSLVHGAAVPGRPAGQQGRVARALAGSRPCPSPATTCSRRPGASTTASTACGSSSPTRRTSSVRLVVNPERMVIAEARRTYTYLSLFGYRVDAVDRQPPAARRGRPTRGSTGGRRCTPSTSRRIEEGFAPLPVLRAELAADELVGLDAPARLRSPRSTASRDPAASCTRASPCKVTRRDGRTTLVARAARSPTATISSSAAAATSCSSGSGPTGGRSCCRTRCGAGPWTTPA